ncbi:hypothetical protein COEREDRAFT_5939 [Coemansia reversa NRRL 1564]|uniref:Ubiquitin-like domain-containing protein n=1 Tax=Coemansia reversa (strain ATCC 12441 / NRRL 1564) TaxID=763665 RepID=A0A2G5BK97_COERN|nr:hypothetical protein COEREDRAFT_5939 [Coemansia reversa NRRL 1564]|eukprot:PIA19436.1 hypothetical protein COEREDRAFT_5939 [Coemansia reversa NRRL 1564]
MADVRVSKPYFRLKRGALTVFVETKSTDKISTIKTKLLSALHAQDEDGLFSNLSVDSIQLIAPQHQRQQQQDQQQQDQQEQPQPAQDSGGQLRPLLDNDKIGAGDLIDDGIIYFVFKQQDGTYEEPSVVDYDADTHDMGAACY